VNSTPLPLILRVLPDPTSPGLSSPSTLYRTFRMSGRRSDARRSSLASVRPGILFDIATAARENSYTARNGPVFVATKLRRPTKRKLNALPLPQAGFSGEQHAPTAHIERLARSDIPYRLLSSQHIIMDVTLDASSRT
jgi:hypothetical protein